jgi:hypothetical protein
VVAAVVAAAVHHGIKGAAEAALVLRHRMMYVTWRPANTK